MEKYIWYSHFNRTEGGDLAEGMKVCPFCGAEVKKANLNRHLRKVHGGLDKKEFEKKGIASPVKTKSKTTMEREKKKDDAIKARKRKRDTSMIAAIVAVIVVVCVVGVIVYQNLTSNESNGGPSNGNNPPVNPKAVMSTSLGTIKIELYQAAAPTTVGNFVSLAGSNFYNGVVFHRVVANFVIQAGGFTSDRTPKTASQIPWEDTGYKNLKYTIAMARSGSPDSEQDSGTGSSQFFINLKYNSNLDGFAYPYVVFGIVTEGQNVVDAIGALPTESDEWPIDPPVINSVVIE